MKGLAPLNVTPYCATRPTNNRKSINESHVMEHVDLLSLLVLFAVTQKSKVMQPPSRLTLKYRLEAGWMSVRKLSSFLILIECRILSNMYCAAVVFFQLTWLYLLTWSLQTRRQISLINRFREQALLHKEFQIYDTHLISWVSKC